MTYRICWGLVKVAANRPTHGGGDGGTFAVATRKNVRQAHDLPIYSVGKTLLSRSALRHAILSDRAVTPHPNPPYRRSHSHPPVLRQYLCGRAEVPPARSRPGERPFRCRVGPGLRRHHRRQGGAGRVYQRDAVPQAGAGDAGGGPPPRGSPRETGGEGVLKTIEGGPAWIIHNEVIEPVFYALETDVCPLLSIFLSA